MIKVAINGFGRIGRALCKLVTNEPNMQIVAINDIATTDMMEYLLKFDSIHGNFEDVKLDGEHLLLKGQRVNIYHEQNPKNIDFSKDEADIVVECSGKFLTTHDTAHHIEKGVKRVIISAPATDDTPTFVYKVNTNFYANQQIISNASCTTNCLAPILQIINDNFGIQKGVVTTIHSYTNDQNLIDANHTKDKRRSRAAGVNIVPTYTGAAKAIDKVLPELKDKLHGRSVRVPVANVSMADINLVIEKNSTKDEINQILSQNANTIFKNILQIDYEFRVSSDFISNSSNAIIASDLTQVVDGNLIKIMAWYDNEWGYSNRLVDMIKFVLNK